MLIFYVGLCIFIAALVALADYACGMEKLQDASGTIVNPATSEDVDAATTSIDAVRSAVTTSTLNVNDATAILWQQYLWSALTSSTINSQVTGSVTVSDSHATPTDSLNVQSHLAGWSGSVFRLIGAALPNADGLSTSGAAQLGLFVRSAMYGYNGSTLDRLTSTTANGLDVDVTRIPTAHVDTQTNAIITIPTDHHEIHEGTSFVVTSVVTVTAASSYDFQITTPNTATRIHYELEYENYNNGVTVAIYEAPTTSGGTALTAYNRERNSATAAAASMVYGPTVTSTGTTTIFMHYSGSNIRDTNGSRGLAEYVLKQNTKYLIRFTADSGTNVTLSVKHNWYEL